MTLRASKTTLPEVLILDSNVFEDDRGFFFESFNKKEFYSQTGLNIDFVQDNHSKTKKNTLRGLHYQIIKPQGKLVRVIQGRIYDVAIDLRRSSSNFGQWVGIELSSENKKQLWIPEGFAHGFVALSETADVIYKTTDYWFPKYERCLIWSDADIGIKWPINNPKLSDKDKRGIKLKDAVVYE
jgi:dTDP-4-dehydrorhamnose 3,5-epimerase